MKTVVLITTGQPSVNPRIVKEADTLFANGYRVVVLYCYWIEWAYQADKALLKNINWEYQMVGGSPSENKIAYVLTRLRLKFNLILNKKGLNKLLVAERAQARCYDELVHAAKSIKADLYIGHNLGALPVAVKAAAHNKGRAAFDFEDYHRDENSGEKQTTLQRIVFLEEKYVPGLSYISAASPMIAERIQSNFKSFSKPVITLLNCFPISQKAKQKPSEIRDNTLQLFWFSQTVGKNRGLEAVVLALKELRNPNIHLTLAGRCDDNLLEFIGSNGPNLKETIHFAGIIQPEELPAFTAKFDVGLATELSTPLNRNFCLTNKIFTYLLAGNCILASDTDAQKDFMERYPGIGLLYKNGVVNDLASKIRLLYEDKSLLRQYKQNSLALATETLHWEKESEKLTEMVNTITRNSIRTTPF